MAVGSDRIKRGATEKHRDQDVTNISSPHQLLRYAMAGQLAHLLERREDLNQGKIAHAALGGDPRNAASKLSTALATGPSADLSRNLDEIIGALDPDLESTGGLCSLALRLAEEDRGRQQIKDSLTAHVPPSWTRNY